MSRPWLWLWIGLWCLAWALIVTASLAHPYYIRQLDLDRPSAFLQHFIPYAAMVASAVLFCRRPRHLVLVAVVAVAIGGVIELLQLLAPRRGTSLEDVLANALGAGLGLLLGLLWLWLRGRWRSFRARGADPAAAE